jgi:hypothetical protein
LLNYLNSKIQNLFHNYESLNENTNNSNNSINISNDNSSESLIQNGFHENEESIELNSEDTLKKLLNLTYCLYLSENKKLNLAVVNNISNFLSKIKNETSKYNELNLPINFKSFHNKLLTFFLIFKKASNYLNFNEREQGLFKVLIGFIDNKVLFVEDEYDLNLLLFHIISSLWRRLDKEVLKLFIHEYQKITQVKINWRIIEDYSNTCQTCNYNHANMTPGQFKSKLILKENFYSNSLLSKKRKIDQNDDSNNDKKIKLM